MLSKYLCAEAPAAEPPPEVFVEADEPCAPSSGGILVICYLDISYWRNEGGNEGT